MALTLAFLIDSLSCSLSAAAAANSLLAADHAPTEGVNVRALTSSAFSPAIRQGA